MLKVVLKLLNESRLAYKDDLVVAGVELFLQLSQ